MVEDITGSAFLLITFVGALVGMIAGLFGIGGGFLIVPVLNIALGIPMQVAVGSAACQVLGPATTSVLARRITREDLRLPLVITGGLLVGVFAGATLLHRLTTPSADPGHHSGGEIMILSIYLVLLLGLGTFALWESAREMNDRQIPSGWLSRVRLPPSFIVEGIRRPVSVAMMSWFGLGVGFLSGLLGISGGLLLLPGLVYLLGQEWHRAVTTSMLIVWLVAFQSTIAHSIHDHIRLPVVIGLLLGGTIGARLGVEWSRGVTPVRGRRSFGWLALSTAVVISIKLFRDL